MTDSPPENEKCTKCIGNNICRLCLGVSDSFIPLFKEKGLEHHLLEKIAKHLPVKISQTDSFPHQVCHHCCSTLLAFDSLYKTCLYADKKLQCLERGKSDDKLENLGTNIDDVSMPLKKRKPLDEDDESTLTESVVLCSLITSDNTKGNNDSSKHLQSPSKSLVQSNQEAIIDSDQPETVSLDALTSMIKDDSDFNFPGKILPEITINEGSGNRETQNFQKEGKESNTIPQRKHRKKKHKDTGSSKHWRCKICNNVYKTEANLDRHNRREHLTDQVECPVCHERFNSRKLNLHLKSVHGVNSGSPETHNQFKCHHCGKHFKNKYVRNTHEKEVHLSEPVQCKLCDFKGTRTVLKRHKRYVHTEKRFFCSLCPSAFKTLHTLKLHMTSHSDVRCYTCDICGMGFKRLNNVRDHMKCHEEKSNQCQICGNFFARKRYLAIHEKTIHNFYADGIVPEEKGFECEICGAKLKWKKNLLAHMRIHTGEKPYVCKICNKNFNCHGTLKTHMTKHNVFNESELMPPPPPQVVTTDINVFTPQPQPV